MPELKLKREIVNPDNVVGIPAEHDLADGGENFVLKEIEAPDPVVDWQAALDAFEYPAQDIEITDQIIERVTGRRLTVSSRPSRCAA